MPFRTIATMISLIDTTIRVNSAGSSDVKPKPENFSSSGHHSFSLDTVAQMNIGDVEPTVFDRYLTKQLKRSERLKARLECKQVFEKKLRKFGFHEQADKLKKCCANFTTLVCGNGHSFRPIVDYRCHLPFCPDCWEAKSHRELKRTLPKILQALRDDESLILAFATLTLKSDKARDLRGGCTKIKSDFRKLRKRQIFDNCVGGYGRIENTFSNKFKWHPHIHNLFLLKNYIPQNLLSDAWNGVTGDSMIVDIRTVHDVAAGLVETIKYPFKPADLKDLGKPEIRQMLELKGERLGLSFGVLFGIETDDDIESEIKGEYSEFIEETKVLEIGDACPICQTKLDLIDFSVGGYVGFLGSLPVAPNTRGKPPLIH